VIARSNLKSCRILILVVLIGLSTGCAERPVKDGTQGVLRFNDEPVANIRVTINRIDPKGVKPVGYGVTEADGTFQLVTHAGRAGVKLTPGNYCCTLKSMGGSIRIPNHYAEVNTTPLKVSWLETDTSLNLKVRDAATQSPPH
jgi:hypothetical protein